MRALARAAGTVDVDRLEAWGRLLAVRLGSGKGRLLVAGNGGSAAEAQHLTSELVGRFHTDRTPLSAMALHADSSAMTAIGNDFGFAEVFARQVHAHGRAGDVLLVLSTSGESVNLLRAVERARELGLTTWALTGSSPNPLAAQCDEVVAVDAESATVQECHLAAVHIVCAAVDRALGSLPAAPASPAGGLVACRTDPLPARPQRPAERLRMVVLGDAVLDEDVSGTVDRLSPEGPVPVIGAARTVRRPGGAGLAAVMAAREGWDVVLVSAVGTGAAGRAVRALLMDAGVVVVDLALPGGGGGVAVKRRIRSHGRTLMRLDEDPGPVLVGRWTAAAQEAVGAARVVLVCDYGRGMCSRSDVRAALTAAARRVPVVWDPHPRGAGPVEGTAVAVPNAMEARAFAGDDVAGEGLAGDVARGRWLLERWAVRQVAVTRGAEGAVLVQDTVGPPLVVSPPARSIAGADACGAGDRFAVAVAMALGMGRMPSQAANVAVRAASAYVADGGPASLDPSAFAAPSGEATGSNAWTVLAEVRARGGTVVATGGCFDLLHPGHIGLLEQARRLGDCLVVCLNSDASVGRLKGPSRPLVPERDRATVLAALGCVDAVVVFAESTPEQILTRIRPDVYVKGGDYGIGDIPEAAAVAFWGGQVVLVPYVEGPSTTSLISEAVRREGRR
ncbi:D-glycero-beta-D-manno-heptose 1-phosphate adenylyltransferase (plasmid) [Embleya sp. NBC_00888]|uniref:D-glycero-beta-D-manno-heptose 1-phosphate adenylyltransferase n=1 Tax=Embleya sp. NBC_00888 TaxID=2975960 RepID=UPI002F91B510|nr:D-glycero-beta-D-manno-heptose 1-phosphate adenylyltransferase [Embleya sp. NBC_00888]